MYRMIPWVMGWISIAAMETAHAGIGPLQDNESVPYLGVASAKLSEDLRAQLDMPEGVGLVVEHVDENSPAQGAGILRMDVLRTFDTQLLITPEQLGVLVRTRRPGDRIALGIIRKSKAQEIYVTLGRRAPEARIKMDTTEFAVAQMFTQTGDGKNRNLSARVITFSDGEHEVTLQWTGETPVLMVRQTAGKVLYAGAVHPDRLPDQLPREIQKKVVFLMGMSEDAESTWKDRKRMLEVKINPAQESAPVKQEKP